ncbi:flagellar basal body-associated FliL family protein [Thiocystis minor]|uniref:flagellar basal body-associated FliL family protein n=1 Tax=Thiocystis minor TaxID=61597 RepID=UPI003B8352AC
MRFLRLNITIVTRDQNVVAAVDKHLPLIRNDLLAHLSEQNYGTVNTPEGKAAILNLPPLPARAACGWWPRWLKCLQHEIEQVLPGIEGQVLGQGTQMLEEGAA